MTIDGVGPLRAILGPAALMIAAAAFLCGCSRQERDPRIVRVDPPAMPGAITPHLVAIEGGALLSWFEPHGEDGAAGELKFARLGSATGRWEWGPARRVIQGAGFFANWADFPSIHPGRDGLLLAHWLERLSDAKYAYGVHLARSADGGTTWQGLGLAHDDDSPTEHGFVSLVADGAGFRAFWLDGRQMEMGGPMTLRTALVGETVGGSEVLDERVCDCCQTAAAMTARGPIVLYRDRTSEEIRDISIVRRQEERWLPPETVAADGWEVPGCPVNGPAVAVDRSGTRVAAAWFTAAGNRPRVQAALSRDAGGSFGASLILDDAAPAGRVGIALDEGGDAIVVWLGGGPEESAPVLLNRVAWSAGAEPALGSPITVTRASRARASGLPRVARAGESVVVAWTETGDEGGVRAAVVPLSMLDGRAPAAPEAGSARVWDGRPGSRAPAYQAATLDGAPFTLDGQRGHPVLLNVWATWCLPCRQEIPVLAALHRDHAAAGLRVVGVSVDAAGDLARLKGFVARERIPYTIVHDPDDTASRIFGLAMLPATFLFDRDGLLVWRRDGVVSRDDPDLRRQIDLLLASR